MFSMQSVSENPLIATFQLSSAASLNLGQSQDGVLGNGLTLYHTIPTFNHPMEEGFGKHGGWLPAFSPFPTVFSTLSRREIIILTTSI